MNNHTVIHKQWPRHYHHYPPWIHYHHHPLRIQQPLLGFVQSNHFLAHNNTSHMLWFCNNDPIIATIAKYIQPIIQQGYSKTSPGSNPNSDRAAHSYCLQLSYSETDNCNRAIQMEPPHWGSIHCVLWNYHHSPLHRVTHQWICNKQFTPTYPNNDHVIITIIHQGYSQPFLGFIQLRIHQPFLAAMQWRIHQPSHLIE